MQYDSILIVIFGAAFLGSFIQAVSGFGYAIVLMSVLPFFINIQTSAVLEVFTSTIMVGAIALRYRKNIRWKLIVIPLIANSVFGYIGILIQSFAPEKLLRCVLGICLIVLSLWMMKSHTKRQMKNKTLFGLLAGTLSGFMGGMMSIGGPPMVLYYLDATDTKEEYTATLQTYFLFSTVYLFMTHILMGHFSSQVFRYSIAALAGLGAGTVFGLSIFKKIKQDVFRKVVYLFMAFAGIYMLLS